MPADPTCVVLTVLVPEEFCATVSEAGLAVIVKSAVGDAVGVGEGLGVTVGVTVGVALGVGLGVGVGVGVGVPPQLLNLNEPMRVFQLNAPLLGMYSVVYQNVQSSDGSTVIEL